MLQCLEEKTVLESIKVFILPCNLGEDNTLPLGCYMGAKFFLDPLSIYFFRTPHKQTPVPLGADQVKVPGLLLEGLLFDPSSAPKALVLLAELPLPFKI